MGAGKFACSKGKRGEQEAVKVLQPTVDKVYEARGLEPVRLYRNKNQSDQGGFDVDGIDWMALEIKRQETLNLNNWWKQAVRQAGTDQVPVLMYRQNNKKWKVQMYGYLALDDSYGGKRVKTRMEISIEAFLIYFETKLCLMLDENGG